MVGAEAVAIELSSVILVGSLLAVLDEGPISSSKEGVLDIDLARLLIVSVACAF